MYVGQSTILIYSHMEISMEHSIMKRSTHKSLMLWKIHKLLFNVLVDLNSDDSKWISSSEKNYVLSGLISFHTCTSYMFVVCWLKHLLITHRDEYFFLSKPPKWEKSDLPKKVFFPSNLMYRSVTYGLAKYLKISDIKTTSSADIMNIFWPGTLAN